VVNAKAAELRELPDELLIDRLEGNKEELFNLRFQLATGQLDDPNRIKVVRHDIARTLTILRQRHLESEVEQEVARADAEALGESRAAQARGEKTGRSLADIQQEALSESEEGADAEAGEGEKPYGEASDEEDR